MPIDQAKPRSITERAKNLTDTILLEIQVNGIDAGTHEWCVTMVERAIRAAAPASVAAGLEMAAKVADDHSVAWGLAHSTPAIAIASAIRALAALAPAEDDKAQSGMGG